MNLDPLREALLKPLRARLASRIARSLREEPWQEGKSLSIAKPSMPGDFNALIASASSRYDVPEGLVRSVIKAESNFDPTVVSSAGAKGLMQLMDETARGLGVRDSFDPAQNIDGGVRFLRAMLDRYNNVSLALAAYNAGPGAVDRHKGIPPYAETQIYVKRVMKLWQQEWIA